MQAQGQSKLLPVAGTLVIQEPPKLGRLRQGAQRPDFMGFYAFLALLNIGTSPVKRTQQGTFVGGAEIASF